MHASLSEHTTKCEELIRIAYTKPEIIFITHTYTHLLIKVLTGRNAINVNVVLQHVKLINVRIKSSVNKISIKETRSMLRLCLL